MRAASVVALESSSAQTGWRLPVRALKTTTGERPRRLARRSASPGSLLAASAAALSSPGTLTMIIEPGLKPSARFMSVGSIGLPSSLRGMAALGRFRRRPVSVVLSRLVSASLGHGSRLCLACAAVGAISSAASSATAASPLPMRRSYIRARGYGPSVDLVAADRAHLWHPFTQQQGWVEEEPLIVERAAGTDLIDVDGRRYIDGVSSLWCNVHGHCHPRIDAAVRDQLGRVARSTMLGLSHQPGIELARRLAELAPPGLTRVFYSDSGSTATEIALKMAFQYWRQRGEQRTKFVSLRMAYHGDTIGSVSVGGIDLFHSAYRPLLFDTLQAEPGDASSMDRLLAGHRGEVAAVIMEPLVQGAAGMLVH